MKKIKCILFVIMIMLSLFGCSRADMETPVLNVTEQPEIAETTPLTTAPTTAPITYPTTEPTPEPTTLYSSNEAYEPETIRYDTIINYYRDFMRDNEDFDEAVNNLYDNIANKIGLGNDQKAYELWCSCVEVSDSILGYAIHDINNDGIPELIILSDDYFIYAIYSLHNDVPILVRAYWSRNSCVIDETGTLYLHVSGGASDSYSASYLIMPDNSELQLMEVVGVESYDEEKGEVLSQPQYYRIQNEDKTVIDHEEALIAWGNFPDFYEDNPTKNIGLTFIPLLK